MRNASGLPSEPLEFFLDEANSAHAIIEALRAAGETVHLHREHFTPGIPDTEWLPVIGEKGWIVLTKDAEIRRNGLERMALLNANTRSFVIVAKGMTGQQMAAMIIASLPKIKRFVAKHPAPLLPKSKLEA